MDGFLETALTVLAKAALENKRSITKAVVVGTMSLLGVTGVVYLQDKEIRSLRKRVGLLETKLDSLAEPVYEGEGTCD